MPRDVHVDHEEIRQKRAQMEVVLDDLMKRRAELEEIPAEMVREASMHTADGRPAPVFGPLINSTQAAVERLQKSLDAVHYRVQKDLEILTDMSASVQQQAEDSAQGIAASDYAFDRTAPVGWTGAPMPKRGLDLDSPRGARFSGNRQTPAGWDGAPMPKAT